MSWSRGRPPRLRQVFQSLGPPVYFVTLCVLNRQRILANKDVHAAFVAFAQRGQSEHGVAVGEYVIMPDHIHLFVRLPSERKLTDWARMLKQGGLGRPASGHLRLAARILRSPAPPQRELRGEVGICAHEPRSGWLG